jgi:ribosomal protein L35
MKTNKSFSKRLRVTKNGKIIARKPGQNHFNAKESGNKGLSKKRTVILKLSGRIKRQFLAGK